MQRLFEPGRNCQRVCRAARAAVLIDAAAYFRAFADAALRATRSIAMVGWDFDTRTRLAFDELAPGAPAEMGDFLNFLVKRRRGLRVHVLNWDYPMIFGTDRETRPIYGLGWKPHRRVQLHYDNTHPVGGSHHQKIVVIDEAIAFSGGLDLTGRRWDTCEHRAHERRRTLDGEPYPPFHDAMALVDGEAAKALADIVRERWRLATGHEIAPVEAQGDPWPRDIAPMLFDVATAVSRTVPGTRLTQEVREVEALYLDMIAAARRTIYIENQYFTSDRIGAALAARLAEPDPPEIVLVTRLLSHGWLEENTMHVLRTRLVKELRSADHAQRFEVYYPHVPDLREGTCVDVHSKLMIVDDRWLRVGSANLSNRSMGFDTECDLTFDAAGDARLEGAIASVRNALLAEHLGVAPSRVEDALARTGSLHGAIRALRHDARSMRVLDEGPMPSEAVMSVVSVADPERPVALDELIDEFAPDTAPHRRPAWGKLAIIAAVVVALALVWRYTPLASRVSPERVIEWADSVDTVWWAPIALAAAYTPAAFVMFPRPLLTLFGAIAFGPVLGFCYAMAGILGASTATYYLGRALPRDTVRHLAGDRVNNLTEALRRRGLAAVFAVRVLPAAPFAVEGIVAGAIHIKLWHLLLGTVLGMLPGTLATTVFGDQIRNALIDPSTINWVVVVAVLLLFLVLIGIARIWFRNMSRRAAADFPRKLVA